jgi:hypothetical protein
MKTHAREMPGSRFLSVCCAVLVILAAGCMPPPKDIAEAIKAINKAFRADYEVILKENGTRVYKVTRAEAYDAVRVSLARLGMIVEAQDPVLGYVNVYAPAPLPLSQEEWRHASEADLPRAREIIGPYVGLFAHFFKFEPEGLEVVIGGTVVEVPTGVAVSYTARMREVAPPKSGMPRREYLPPTAVQMGLDKMWRELQREFDTTYRKR